MEDPCELYTTILVRVWHLRSNSIKDPVLALDAFRRDESIEITTDCRGAMAYLLDKDALR
jgi:hypothetical protein